MAIHWQGKNQFLLAQCQVAVILAVAYMGDRFPRSYPRNDNHNPSMFWVMNCVLLVAALVSSKREESKRGIQLLSRNQTEEWKGWMQWAFIMYHYYRMYSAYNYIRVFVSAYVWMTGFGNFMYFDKKQDFSIDRMVSMWLRINYFPLLLSTFLGVPLELYYVVPLHTVGFFITMATCYVASLLKDKLSWGYWKSNLGALLLCTLVHVAFYETKAVDFLLFFSKEYHFRFQSDKYSALVGIASGLVWKQLVEYMQWAYSGEEVVWAKWFQRFAGVGLIGFWYYFFGYITDKYTYNPYHPYIFWLPVFGWLMLRNSSKWLTEIHSQALEFFGRITLETYVLQFHVFMCNQVQHIPIVLPGATADGPLWIKTANMLLCGTAFVGLALWARTVTVTTQTTVVELMGELRRKSIASRYPNDSDIETEDDDEIDLAEREKLVDKKESGIDAATTTGENGVDSKV